MFSREHSARILVSVVVSTESSNYRQEAEGRGVVWAMELESGRALNTVLALHKVAKMLAGALKKYSTGSKNTSWLKRRRLQSIRGMGYKGRDAVRCGGVQL